MPPSIAVKLSASPVAAPLPENKATGDILSPKGADPASALPDRDAPFLGVHAVNVFVRDQDQSIRFFVEQLGFNLAFDGRLQSGDRWVAVAPLDGTTVLALIAPKADSARDRVIGRPTGIVFLTENVVAKYEEWRKRGVRFLFTPGSASTSE